MSYPSRGDGEGGAAHARAAASSIAGGDHADRIREEETVYTCISLSYRGVEMCVRCELGASRFLNLVSDRYEKAEEANEYLRANVAYIAIGRGLDHASFATGPFPEMDLPDISQLDKSISQ